MEIFFSGCPHYYHDNIILYCRRPFANTEEMNEAMIRNWNNRVGAKDTAYILGDFVFVPKSIKDSENLLRILLGV